jgi:hypothetical protein
MTALALVLGILDLILAVCWRYERTSRQRAQRQAKAALQGRDVAVADCFGLEKRLERAQSVNRQLMDRLEARAAQQALPPTPRAVGGAIGCRVGPRGTADPIGAQKGDGAA